MRNLKKTLALVLALAMVMSLVLVVPAGAKTSKAFTDEVLYLGFTKANETYKVSTKDSTSLLSVEAKPSVSPSDDDTYSFKIADTTKSEAMVKLNTRTLTGTSVKTSDKLWLEGKSTSASFDGIVVPLVDGKLVLADMQLQATPFVETLKVPDAFVVGANGVTGLPNQAPITASIRNLIAGDKYTATLTMRVKDATNTDNTITVFSQAFTATSDSWSLSETFYGKNSENADITNQMIKAGTQDGKMAVDYKLTVKADKNYVGALPNEGIKEEKNKEFTGSTVPAVSFDLKLDGTLPTVAPGTDSTFSFKLTDYNSLTFGRLYMLITNSAGKNVALLSADTLSSTAASFVWDGTYQNANAQAGVKTLLDAADVDKDATYAPVGTYTFKIINQKKVTVDNTLGNVDKLADVDDDTNYEDRFESVPFVVGEGKEAVHKVAITFSESNTAKSLIANGTNKAIITATTSKPNLMANFTITDKAGEVVYTSGATSKPDKTAVVEFTGMNNKVTPQVMCADGVYTVTVKVGETEATADLVIGKVIDVTSVKTTEEPVQAGFQAVTEVELTVAPDNASFPEIKDVFIDDNKYFMSYVEDGKLKLFGKEKTPKTFRTSATVQFTNDDTKVMELNVDVVDLEPSTEFIVETTILRQKPGYAGDNNKITWQFLPEGSVGGQPTFTYVKKVGTDYVELTGDELTGAKEIATVADDGIVTFLKSGRVVVKVSALNTDKYVIICSTTEVAEDLILLPSTAELTIKLNKLAQDPSKQNRISAYARPQEVDNDTVTFTSSDAGIVKLLYADETTGVATNKNPNVPEGGHAGAILGVSEGSAVITATTGAKDENGQALVKQITINVVAQ